MEGDSMANQQRHGRVQQEILRSVTDILQKQVNDPRVKGITVTEVELTGDLQDATVYYSSLNEDPQENEEIQKGLDKATGLVRSQVGQRLTTYHTPRLVFKRDESIATGNRIDELLNQIKDQDE